MISKHLFGAAAPALLLVVAVPAQGAVIPAGSVVNSAIFSISCISGPGVPVRAHRITAPWTETGVTWNNFAGAYDPAVLDSFVGTAGWQTADITTLMQGWVDGTVENDGILLEQGADSEGSLYRSSEDWTPDLRPKLDVYFTPPGGSQQHVTIQRLGATPDDVVDAYIWVIMPDYNGNNETLYTGLIWGNEKQSLLRFDFTVEVMGPGTGTPGYWKNHPEAWPVDSITIGGIVYPKATAITLMGTPDAGDKTFTMFRHLVSAKLNVLVGNESSCIDDTIFAADAWMMLHPVGSKVKGNSEAWGLGSPMATELDEYNNGLLCAPHRD